MKKKNAICLIIAFFLLAYSFPLCTLAAQDLSVTSGCSTLKAELPLAGDDQILPSASGVILYELETDTLVYAYRPDARVNPSSMVKILTALVALENSNLDDVVTVTRKVLDSVPIGTVSAELKNEEQVTIRDLLYCSVMASANDATAVLASHIAGTQKAFVEMMNQKAEDLGCLDSHFTNVHGLNDETQHSTARDLAIITQAALQNEVFSQIFTADQYTIPSTNKSEERTVYTTNYMQTEKYLSTHYDSRVTGGKTAAATHTKRSLICTASVGSARYLCVVMDADTVMSEDNLSVEKFGSFLETKALLDFAKQNYAVRQVLDDGQAYSQHTVSGGENDVVLAPSGDMYTVLPLDFISEDLTFFLDANAVSFSAPISAGDVLAALRVSYRGIILGEYDLVAMNPVALDGSVITQAPKNDESETPVEGMDLWLILTLISFAVLVIVIFSVVAVRWIRNIRIRRLYQRRKQNRERGK